MNDPEMTAVDFELVGIIERPEDVAYDVCDDLDRQTAGRDQLPEVDPVDQLHNKVVAIVAVAVEVENRRDARVLEE